MINQIRKKLIDAFSPDHITIKDQSHLHKGHAGYNPNGPSHLKIMLVSDEFNGFSRLQRHRMVNDILQEELAGDLHALTMKLYTPEEYNKI